MNFTAYKSMFRTLSDVALIHGKSMIITSIIYIFIIFSWQ